MKKERISEIANKMRKIESLDINDYVKSRCYKDITNLDTCKHQTPFLHWRIQDDEMVTTYDDENYQNLTNRLKEITGCLLDGMVSECNKLFAKAGYSTIDIHDISEPDISKRFSAFLSKFNETLFERYDADIAIKLAEIKLKYARPKLYNSLFFAYCQLYETASHYKDMHTRYNEYNEEFFDLWSDYRNTISRCRTLAQTCKRIKVSISKKEGRESTPIKDIQINGEHGQYIRIPEVCYPLAYFDLKCNDSLKWILDRYEITFELEKGQEFDAVRNWLLNTLYREDNVKGYDKRFAKAFNGLYRFIMDSDFVAKLNFPPNTTFHSVTAKVNRRGERERDKKKKERAIELIRILFDLPKSATIPLNNYIDRP